MLIERVGGREGGRGEGGEGGEREEILAVFLTRHVVLDEADQMLERGFADTVEEILAAAFNHGGCVSE